MVDPAFRQIALTEKLQRAMGYAAMMVHLTIDPFTGEVLDK